MSQKAIQGEVPCIGNVEPSFGLIQNGLSHLSLRTSSNTNWDLNFVRFP